MPSTVVPLDINLLNQAISFSLYSATGAIIGTTFNEVTLLDFLSPQSAMAFDNVAQLHANVYPTLPYGTAVDDYTSYNYIKVRQPGSNQVNIIGIPWIQGGVSVFSSSKVTATVINAEPGDAQNILELLLANGYLPDNVNVTLN